MSLEVIKSTIAAGCIGLVGLFSVSAHALSVSDDLGVLQSGGTIDYLVDAHNTGGDDFTDTFFFSVDSGVPATNTSASSFQFGTEGIDGFMVELYDSGDNLLSTNGAVNHGFTSDVFFTHAGTGDFKLLITGLTTGSGGGIYGLTLTAVPLPAAAWLFISGFLAIGGWSVFKRKREEKSSFSQGAVTA